MNIEQLIKQVLREKNWSSTYMFNLIRRETDHLFEAAINRHTWEIELIVDPEIEEKAKKYFPQNTEKILSDIIYSTLSHEKGHWEHCPFDIEYFEAIYSAISETIKGKIPEDKVGQYTSRIANQFMDIIDNINLAFVDQDKKRFKNGRYNIYKKEIQLGDSQFGDSEEYKIFVGIQQEIYFDQKDLVQEPNLKNTIEKGKRIFIEDYKKEKDILKEIKRDKEKWREKASAYAELVLPHIDLDEGDPTGGNEFTDQMEGDEEFKKQVIVQGLKSGHDVSYANQSEFLDAYYSEKAKEIVLDYLKNQGLSSKLPVAWLQKRKIEDGEMFNVEDIDWPSTMIMPAKQEKDEEIEIYKKQVPVEIDENCLQSVGSMPDIALIVDSSGSMHWRKTDSNKIRGEYDLLLQAAYSIFNYLEKTGKGQYINYSAINFSRKGRTEFSGWHDYYNLNKVKETLFNHQGNSTHLDTDELSNLVDTAKDNFLAIMVTDGELDNKKEAAKKVEQVIQKGNDFVLIQIGDMTDFAEKIKNYGAEVYTIKKPEDLIGLTLKKTKDKWG